MARAKRVCTTTGCPTLVDSGRCTRCEADAERRRGTASQRGYGGAGHRAFRTAVLRRDPICVVCRVRPSQHADHHPMTRRDLVAAGLNPDDPARGRGVCSPCHSTETAHNQPGGWNAR